MNTEIGTVASILAAAEARLGAAGVPTPAVDARLLLGHVLGVRPTALVLEGGRRVTAAEASELDRLVAERVARRPLQHILGTVEFHGRVFRVTPGVLVPRFETECVVERALIALAEMDAETAGSRPSRIADIGTGAGVIGVTLAAERPADAIVATDRSARALALAAENARALGVAGRLHFCAADLTTAFAGEAFDLIAANPPYVRRDSIAALAPEVRDHDPRLALDGGADGLEAVTRLLADARRVLRPGGRLVIEIGDEQGAQARDLALAYGLDRVGVHVDLSGRDRVLTARRFR